VCVLRLCLRCWTTVPRISGVIEGRGRGNCPPGSSDVCPFKVVVLKLGSAVRVRETIIWDREAHTKKIKTTLLEKKICIKDFQEWRPVAQNLGSAARVKQKLT